MKGLRHRLGINEDRGPRWMEAIPAHSEDAMLCAAATVTPSSFRGLTVTAASAGTPLWKDHQQGYVKIFKRSRKQVGPNAAGKLESKKAVIRWRLFAPATTVERAVTVDSLPESACEDRRRLGPLPLAATPS